MQLYHFTSAQHLRGIAQYGLTVGDVPTDLGRLDGKIGVWLTTSMRPDGHGLGGSRVNKTAFRLAVEVPADGPLHKWTTWALTNVSRQTFEALKTDDAHKYDEFYLYFGWLRPEDIVDVVDVACARSVANWKSLLAQSESLPGVSFQRRKAWQKRMFGAVRSNLKAIHSQKGLR
jgi:hypothetical protein